MFSRNSKAIGLDKSRVLIEGAGEGLLIGAVVEVAVAGFEGGCLLTVIVFFDGVLAFHLVQRLRVDVKGLRDGFGL